MIIYRKILRGKFLIGNKLIHLLGRNTKRVLSNLLTKYAMKKQNIRGGWVMIKHPREAYDHPELCYRLI
jgi:hypothetical protein